MVRRKLWVTLLAYGLIRRVTTTAAAVHPKQSRQLRFTRACQSILASWRLLVTGAYREVRAVNAMMLAQIAAREVANRPGRIEPRVLKHRRHRYRLMERPADNYARNYRRRNPKSYQGLRTAAPSARDRQDTSHPLCSLHRHPRVHKSGPDGIERSGHR